MNTRPWNACHSSAPARQKTKRRRLACGLAMRCLASVCKVLDVPLNLAVLEVHRVALTFGEKPVEYRVSTIDTHITIM